MPLTNPRFAGDQVLEACLAGAHRMMTPESGPAVGKVQQALIDLGYSLVGGADGSFGNETGAAVSAYKSAHGLFPPDPVVGSGTMAALDTDPGYPPTTPGGPLTVQVEQAEALLANARATLAELAELLEEVKRGLVQ
jgi:peptidoglycan hydrolase-like protein with peptidoglycan-binding domain